MKLRLSPEPALSLALLRIVVPPLMLWAPGFRASAEVADWDRARFVVPEGLGWFVRLAVISPGAVTVFQLIMAFSAFAAMLGLRARLSLFALTLSGFYLYSIAQLTGFVWHDMHLLWFSALLTLSPCADVLAVDAHRPVDAEGIEYAEPLLVFRLLFSAVYFFPGLHKILESGLDWALSDNLQNQLYWKWAEHGYVPSFRLDRHPFLLHLGGVFTLVFELSFPLLVAFRRSRPIAAAAGICFHILSQLIFRIAFASLWLCYVGFLDLRPLVKKFFRRVPVDRGGSPVPSPWPLRIVGGLLVSAVVVQGIRGQMSSYPFACYPTFQWRATSEMPDLLIAAVGADGTPRELRHARTNGYRTQREWGQIWRLAGATGSVDEARLRAYFASIRRRPENQPLLQGARSVRFFRAYRSVRPEDGARITRGVLLLDMKLVTP